MPPQAHRSDRSDRTTHRIGTPAPAWPCGPASVSDERVSPADLVDPAPCGSRSSSNIGGFRSGSLAVQAALPSSYTGVLPAPAPSLHGDWPLPRYYEPVRLPARAARSVMDSLAACGTGTPLPRPGLPGSSVDLSTCAAPFHPGRPDACTCPLLPHRFQASPSSAGWPLLIGVTRPNRVRLCCGSRVRSPRASPAGSLRPHVRFATC